MVCGGLEPRYVGGSCCAACIVLRKQHIATVVCRLRQAKILRKGRNVTPFNAGLYHVAPLKADGENYVGVSGPAAAIPAVGLRCWSLSPKPDEGAVTLHAADNCVLSREKLIAWTLSNDDAFAWEALQIQEWCYAVHFVGGLSEGLLEELLTCTVSGDCGVDEYAVKCVVPQLLVYSEACCDVGDLPHAIYQLRAETLRLRQLEKSCNGDDATARHGVKASQKSCSYDRRGKEAFPSFTFSELFAGIGMFRIGMERIGGRCVFAVECAPHACNIYRRNHNKPLERSEGVRDERMPREVSLEPPPPLVGDITAIPSSYFPPHDVLTAGFPCQSFAKAGPGTGLSDTKGELFYEVVRVIRSTMPKGFLLENVENLLFLTDSGCVGSCEGSQQLLAILDALQRPSTDSSSTLSYVVDYRVIDGALVTPQRRRRVYFVGVRGDLPRANKEHLSASLDAAVEELKRYREAHPDAAHCVRDILDNTCGYEVSGKCAQPLESLRLSESQWAAVQRSETYRRCPAWRVADLDGVARTLMGSYRNSYQLYSEFVPVSEGTPPFRFYSIYECARLQGIPRWFSFGETPQRLDKSNDGYCAVNVPVGAVYKLIGNAVNPIVIEHVGRALLKHVID